MRIREKRGAELYNRTAVIEMILTGTWVQEVLTDALKPYMISIAQFNVLRILRGQQGKPASLACIQEKMVHKMSNTTRLVDKLLDKGFVERIVCPENRRKVEITITAKGQSTLKDLDKVISAAEQNIMKNLDEQEVNILIHLLKKIKD